jgi:hypothetical protein
MTLKLTKAITAAAIVVAVAAAIIVPVSIAGHSEARQSEPVPIVSVHGGIGSLNVGGGTVSGSGGIVPGSNSAEPTPTVAPSSYNQGDSGPHITLASASKCVDILKNRAYPTYDTTQTKIPCQYTQAKYKKVMDVWYNYYILAYSSAKSASNTSISASARSTYNEHAKSYLAEMLAWSAIPIHKTYRGNINAIGNEIMSGWTNTAEVNRVSNVILWQVAYTTALNGYIDSYYKFSDIVSGGGFALTKKAFGIGKPLGLSVYLKILDKTKGVAKFVVSEQTSKVFIPNLYAAI